MANISFIFCSARRSASRPYKFRLSRTSIFKFSQINISSPSGNCLKKILGKFEVLAGRKNVAVIDGFDVEESAWRDAWRDAETLAPYIDPGIALDCLLELLEYE